MGKIGLLGGMGPESTLVYYRLLIDGVGEKLGRGVIPQLTIESIDPEVMHAYCAKGDYDGLTDFFVELIDHLRACGCEAAAMTANTAHIVFDRVSARAGIPMVSITFGMGSVPILFVFISSFTFPPSYMRDSQETFSESCHNLFVPREAAHSAVDFSDHHLHPLRANECIQKNRA